MLATRVDIIFLDLKCLSRVKKVLKHIPKSSVKDIHNLLGHTNHGENIEQAQVEEIVFTYLGSIVSSENHRLLT